MVLISRYMNKKKMNHRDKQRLARRMNKAPILDGLGKLVYYIFLKSNHFQTPNWILRKKAIAKRVEKREAGIKEWAKKRKIKS